MKSRSRATICPLFVVTLLVVYAVPGSSLALTPAQAERNPSQGAGSAVAARRASDEAKRLSDEGSEQSLKAAIAKYEQALQLYRDIGDRGSEGSTLNNVGFVYQSLGDNQKALEYYNQALPVLHDAGDRTGEARTLSNIGLIHSNLGDRQKALEYYNRALLASRSAGDRNGEASTLDNLGVLYAAIDEKQKALDYHNQALPLRRASGDRSGEAGTLNNIGSVFLSLGEHQKALEYCNQALSIVRAVGDRRGEANTLSNIGAIYSSLGDKQRALQYYNEVLAIRRLVVDRRSEATTLSNIGAVYDSLGEMQKALEYYNQALPIRRATGDRAGEAVTLGHIGGVYHDLGDNQKALDYYSQAARILSALGDRTRLAGELFSSIGSVYRSLGAMQKAVEYHQLALAIRRATGDRRGEATTLNNIGAVYYSVGELQKALEYYGQALPVHKAVGDRAGQAAVLNNIGSVYYSLGEKQKALEYYNRALPMRRAAGDRSGEADTLRNLMRLWEVNNSSLAVYYGKQAVNVLQQLRANIAELDKEVQKTFVRTKGITYRELAYLLMALGRLQEAQQVLNLFKDQQYFDFNRNLHKTASVLTLSAREAQIAERYELTTRRVEVVDRQLSEVTRKVGGRQPSTEEATQLQDLQAKMKTALDEFVVLLKQAELEFTQANRERDKVSEIADTRELQSALRQLSQATGQKAVAVYTFVGDERFCALVITADNITVASQPIRGDALNQKALQLWGLLQSDRYDPRPLAQELYSIVFKPIESQLPKDTATILWSLDGNLRYVPMAALYDGNQYLVERYNSIAFTRADSERLLRPVSPRWTGLGLGSSQAHTVELMGEKLAFDSLPGVTEELRTLFRQEGSPGGVLDGEVLPDARFTKTTMLAALKRKRPLVHISSHFNFRPGDEARSFLLLGDGTAMTLEEMKQHTDLFAGVELLTLSACNTAAQRPGANGREIDGFAELAQRLGAGSVMATLWPVADNSTPWLMREFYQTRQNGNGLSKAEAFRRAQLALLNGTAQTKPLPEEQKRASSSSVKIVIAPDDGKGASADTRGAVVRVSEKNAPAFKRDDKKPFAHPYYWSPFILIGNSR
ncbi:MAG TPA: tetratricopeptide repeat protein [Blastocatellia bacterium]|nr:tetratricopeptide repeat protein [Blastocatellia bacterium]